jgi:23S rRNA (adenine2503-C2)-methyltransferase
VRFADSRTAARSLLSDYDRASLAALLAEASGRKLDTCTRVAASAIRLAFLREAAFSESSLTAAGIGAWARPTLLGLTTEPCLSVAETARSSDGTVRLVLTCHDGALVEAVIIPAHAGRATARTTLCISSQVGCARACSFCETGQLGLARQLSAGEIVDQFRIARRLCEADVPTDRRAPVELWPSVGSPRSNSAAKRPPISNIVFMGMGEPLDNLGEVVRAIALLSDPSGFAFPISRITVSTVGVADKLEAFFAATRAELAISINAPDDARREGIMPINRRFDLATLRQALLAALPPGRRVLLQYALFAGFNDSVADADLLADYVAPIPCRVNVIAANPGPDPKLVSPSEESIEAFVARLGARGVTTLVRNPRGRDVGGACGQLAGARRVALVEREEPRC